MRERNIKRILCQEKRVFDDRPVNLLALFVDQLALRHLTTFSTTLIPCDTIVAFFTIGGPDAGIS
ncbi:MAG: hypothetical protein M0Z71_13660 [Nitrospiraceae bacterium]|nr:hypothetical protein [Nitrospiraceae bacterium]